MFACENRADIVLIRSGLLSIFVIAGATGSGNFWSSAASLLLEKIALA
jgi:hypothetical protein